MDRNETGHVLASLLLMYARPRSNCPNAEPADLARTVQTPQPPFTVQSGWRVLSIPGMLPSPGPDACSSRASKLCV